MRKLLFAAALAAAAACTDVEQGTTFIQGAFRLEPADDCLGRASGVEFTPSSLLDLDSNTSGLSLVLKVKSSLPTSSASTGSANYPNFGAVDGANVVSFATSEVFYSTDADRGPDELALVGDGTPVNEASARRSGVSGAVEPGGEGVIFTTALTKEDAVLLAAEDHVSGGGLDGDPNARVRVFANIRLEGQTAGSAAVRTPLFPFAIDLCRGCLSVPPPCQGEEESLAGEVCVRGQDFPDFVCE